MFADLLRLIHRRNPNDYERGFVRHVRVRRKSPRNRRVERFLAACWVLIAAKVVVLPWLVARYHMPFNPLWVIAPTLVFAALGTAVYLLRD